MHKDKHELEALAERAAKDTAALEGFLVAYRPVASAIVRGRYVSKRLISEQDAPDAVSEAVLCVARRLKQPRKSTASWLSICYWVVQTAMRTFISGNSLVRIPKTARKAAMRDFDGGVSNESTQRIRSLMDIISLDAEQVDGGLALHSIIPADIDDPFEAAAKEDKFDTLRRVMSELPPQKRGILEDWARGCTMEEMSKSRGISKQAIHWTIKTTCNRLRGSYRLS